jgi:uncharacterized protein YPO0396
LKCAWIVYYHSAGEELPEELESADIQTLATWMPAEEDTVGARLEAAIKEHVGKVLSDVAAGVGATRDAVNKMKSASTKYEALVRTEEARSAPAARIMTVTCSNSTHPTTNHHRAPCPVAHAHTALRILRPWCP